MAWTSPMTFADGSALTAAQLNTYLRDNLNETMVAKADTIGALFYGSDANSLVQRYPDWGRVDAWESTTSTSYTDLTTIGPAVTVETGTTALVMIAGTIGNNTANSQTIMTYNVSRAGSVYIGSTVNNGIEVDGIAAATDSNYLGCCLFDLRTDLTPGTNTFKCTYRVGSGTGVFGHRFIAVWPLT